MQKKTASVEIAAFIIGNLARQHNAMKRVLILFFLVCANISQAQYFDWNQILFSMSNQDGLARYNNHIVAVDGKQIVQFTMRPCLFCYPETIECYVDSNGNTSGYHNNYLSGYRKSYFDRFGNLIQVRKIGPYYSLNYFLQDTTTISLQDTAPDFVDGDRFKNVYLFFQNTGHTRIGVYDSLGVYVKTLNLPGGSGKLDYSGAFYMCEGNIILNATIVKKYNAAGVFLNDYAFSYFSDLSLSPAEFTISKNSGLVWGVLNNDVLCYDSTGALISSIPLSDNSHVSIAVDDNDRLIVWAGNNITKYNQPSIMWRTTVDASLTEKINVDHHGNIYYICNYAEPFYDFTGVFMPTSFYVPPTLAFKGYSADPGFGIDPNYNIIVGKINNTSSCATNLHIVAVLQDAAAVTELCSRNPFDVRIGYDHLPVAAAMDTVYIEISDLAGSFANPYVIGQGIGLLIPCEIPDTITSGNSYIIRARLGSGITASSHFAQQITVKTSPAVSLILNNSIAEVFSCQPFVFKTTPGLNYSYNWFNVIDLSGNPYYNYFSINDSVINLPINNYEAIGVDVTNNTNGCAVRSKLITPFELDSLNPMDLRIMTPDTLHVNDMPVEIHTPGYLQGAITGLGVQTVGPDNTYYFFPGSVASGVNMLTRTLEHINNPCIPFEKTQYIYVDPSPRNIVCGDVEPIDKLICAGDSVTVPFTLLNPAIYNASNVFIVELCSEDADNGKIIKIADIGSCAISPIMCIVPSNRGNKMRFRIRSSQTNEISSLNANGNITVPVLPYVQFQQNLLTDNCYPTNVAMDIYSSYGQHQWYYNDSLILDNIDWNVGITPTKEGNYKLLLTDPDNGCVEKLGPVTVDDSAHIPLLSTTPASYYLYSCGKTYPLITAQTDAQSSLSWYFENNQIPGTSTSLLTFKQGSYKAVASCSSGCLISVYEPKYVYADPVIVLDNPTTASLCNGNNIELSVNNDYPFYTYNYQWIKNNAVVIAVNRQLTVSDSGNYSVVVSSASGCIDTSKAIQISTSTLAVPAISPSGPITISHGEAVMLSTVNDPGYAYQWFNREVPIYKATKSKYYTSQPGLFTVKITDSYGCSNISLPVTVYHNHKIKHLTPSSLKLIGNDTGQMPFFNIYPNPSNGQFSLIGRNINGNVRINISDLYGRIILDKAFSTSEGKLASEINLESIADGLYFVAVESEDYAISLPFIVTK